MDKLINQHVAEMIQEVKDAGGVPKRIVLGPVAWEKWNKELSPLNKRRCASMSYMGLPIEIDNTARKGNIHVLSKDREKPMTVGQLVQALSIRDPDALVSTEGCDCYGDVGSIEDDPDDNSVLLKRVEDWR